MSTPPFVDLPAGVEARTVTTPRGEFAALMAHPITERSGTTLLVPGFTGSKEDFIAVLRPLAELGYESWTYDQRGQYETPGPDDPEAYELAELATDLRAVATAVRPDGPIHVLGHSFGGLVARLAVLQDAPAFTSLVLLDSGPAAIPTEQERVKLVAMRDALPVHGSPAIWQAIQQLAALEGNSGPQDEDVAAFLEKRFLSNSPIGLATKASHLLTEIDRVEELAATGTPVLVAYGEDDTAWPTDLQAEMSRRLGARCDVIPHAAHSPNSEQPDATAHALARFWDSASAAG